jgi:hypothetical protein
MNEFKSMIHKEYNYQQLYHDREKRLPNNRGNETRTFENYGDEDSLPGDYETIMSIIGCSKREALYMLKEYCNDPVLVIQKFKNFY